MKSAESPKILPPLWRRPPRRRLIELRDAERRPLPYKGDATTGDMRRFLEAYNRLAGASVVVHVGADGIGVPLVTNLHRVFNDGRWDRGGRFYGADHMGLKGGGAARSSILIDGERIAEMDFSGLHIRLLYHLMGMPFDGDPYELVPNQPGRIRTLAKSISLLAINAKDRRSALAAIRWDFRTKFGMRPPPASILIPFVRRFEEIHCQIKEHFFSGAGLRLQAVDSRIAARVINHFTARGVVCLPVHDSFLVQERHADELRGVMTEAYRQETGFDPVIK